MAAGLVALCTLAACEHSASAPALPPPASRAGSIDAVQARIHPYGVRWPGVPLGDWSGAELLMDIRLGGGTHDDLTLHLARPIHRSRPLPALLLVHGGGWGEVGESSDFIALAMDLASRGYVALCPNYRRAPRHRFPAQLEDLQSTVRWVRAFSKEIGVDPERIGAVGDSAGSQLVLLLAMGICGSEMPRDFPGYPSTLNAAVSVSAPTDLALLHERKHKARDDIEKLLGGPPGQAPDLYRRASPIMAAVGRMAPTLIIHGTRDSHVPFYHAQLLYDRWQADGRPVQLLTIVGAGHRYGPRNSVLVMSGILDFFDRAIGHHDNSNTAASEGAHAEAPA